MDEYNNVDYELDKLPKGHTEELRQYIPKQDETEVSDLARKAIEEELRPTEEANKAADFAKTFLEQETVYDMSKGKQSENPLLGDPPYQMSNASFVYWCYKEAGINLRGGDLSHTIQTIKNSTNLETIGRIGSNLDDSNLAYGDIILFNNDKHIGIYIGEGDFISFLGGGVNNYSGGARVRTLRTGKWRRLFRGHILRHREEDEIG